ncbi:interleukin-21 [Triplophysa dalaica]|uniref:interleukin-21 n=1 Tax=Triplophysa dalaica TaxID=1582913 RepID=UPI0024DF6B34|nr:interleukin-21 [Triplophysa dalaica]
MKFVCVLLAVTCLVVAAAEESATILTIRKAMKELKKLEKEYSRGTVTDIMINSPTVNDMKDCCIASALKCFASKVIYLPVNNKMAQKVIHRDLLKTKTILNKVSSCSNETEKAQCKPCNMYPMVEGVTYLENFQTLLQKIFVRLQ